MTAKQRLAAYSLAFVAALSLGVWQIVPSEQIPAWLDLVQRMLAMATSVLAVAHLTPDDLGDDVAGDEE